MRAEVQHAEVTIPSGLAIRIHGWWITIDMDPALRRPRWRRRTRWTHLELVSIGRWPLYLSTSRPKEPDHA